MMKYPTRGDIIQIRSYRLDQIHNSRCVSNVNNNGFRSNHKQQNRKIKSKYVNNLLNDKIRCNERRNISCFSFEAVAPRRTYDKGLFEVENHKLIIDATYGNIVLLFIFYALVFVIFSTSFDVFYMCSMAASLPNTSVSSPTRD